MKAASILAVCCLLCLSVGCSSWNVSQDYDKEADFVSYKTFAWIEQPTMGVGSVKAAQQRNMLLDKRLKAAVETQLRAKGFVEDTENPDILLAYYTGVDDKVDVSSYGYSYPSYYGGWGHYGYGGYGGGGVDVYHYKEGTVIVDLIDARTTQLAWRGSVSGVLETNPTPEKMDKNVNEAMAKMFSQYPPKL